MPKLGPQDALNVIKDMFERNDIEYQDTSFDVDSGGGCYISHVMTAKGKNRDGVVYRAKVRFPAYDTHCYVDGIGFMGKATHFETSATFPFEGSPTMDLLCGVLRAKATLMKTTHIILRTIRVGEMCNGKDTIEAHISDLVIHVENEMNMAAFKDVVQSTLVQDQEVGDAEGNCVIEA